MSRLGKARKRAATSIKTTRRLLKKHGGKVTAAHREEIQTALAALEAAHKAKDREGIYSTLKQLDAAVEARMGHLRKSPAREYAESIGTAVLIALVLRAFIVEAFVIPSGSMIPTLAVGDFLFVNKLSYGLRIPFHGSMPVQWSAPDRGDVVVFVWPCDDKLDYIKRVIGVPGDIIDTDAAGFVYVNGEPVSETEARDFGEYGNFASTGTAAGGPCGGFLPVWNKTTIGAADFGTLHCPSDETPTAGHDRTPYDWGEQKAMQHCPAASDLAEMPPFPWRVPEGHVFAMGDNRRFSSDSRYWGFVPFENIKGKAMFIFMSWDSHPPWSQVFDKVRWRRLFSGVHGIFE